MTRSLKLLLVEDLEDDALLVLRELRRGGFDVRHRRVQTEDDMWTALAEESWDVIISDYMLPRFSGPAALGVLKESGLDVPFIMTSGTVDEETAVEALHAGAHDFMSKQKLARLVPAVERALGDAAERRARRVAEEDVKKLEEQVRHAQKMEAVGRVAGGVAHDFNNILTAIIATADLALDAKGLPEEVRADLQSIRDSGQRASSITRQLLAFSRKQVVQPRTLDINDTVRRCEPMLRRLVPQSVRLEMALAATDCVEADPTQIEQVLLNLVVNAADAMPEGGTLAVSTGALSIDAPTMNNGEVLAPGGYVVLRVADTGIGMDDATIKQIFEPFFTTKGPGHGTGLGLATVYGIVKQAGGQVFVRSRVGEGSVFEVCLPRTELQATHNGAAPAAARASLVGSEVVLLVEDEPAVRAPIARALRQLGYFVLEAQHGEDALRVMQQHHAPVHLLISDVQMPEMTGTELVGLLMDWYPHLKVLLISGYSGELNGDRGPSLGATAYLAKPFTLETLATRVREILTDAADGGNGRGHGRG